MGWTTLHRDPGTTDREFFETEFPSTLARDGKILACATVRSVFYAAVRTRESGQVWALVVLLRRSRAGAGSWYNFGYKEMDERMGPAEARCPTRVPDPGARAAAPLPECRHEQDYCRLCGIEITASGEQWASEARPGQVPEVAGPRCYSGFVAPSGWVRGDPGPFHEPGGAAPCGTCWARDWRQACRATAGRQAHARTVRPGTHIRFAHPVRFASGDMLDTLVFEGRSTFRAPDGPKRYRIRNWRTAHHYEILTAPVTEAGTDE